jgi:hypothetical protein
MKVIAMVDRSNGNETVGDMWTETKIFDSSDTLDSVYEWVAKKVLICHMNNVKTNIKLSIAQE